MTENRVGVVYTREGVKPKKQSSGKGCGCLLLLAAAAVVGVVVANMPDLSSDPGSSQPAAAPAASTPAAVSATDPAVVDAAFTALVRADDSHLGQYPDSQLVQTGQQICSDIRGGTSLHDEAEQLMAQYPAKDAGVLLAVAPGAYCKDLDAQVQAGISQLG